MFIDYNWGYAPGLTKTWKILRTIMIESTSISCQKLNAMHAIIL